jgi:ADP-heptose:LPS heptosyltransferase
VVAGADAVVGWMRDPDGEVARTVSALGVERVVVAPVRPLGGNGEGTHVALALARTLEPLGLGNPPRNLEELARCLPPFAFTPAGAAAAEAVWTMLGLPARGVVALHPGSGGAAKRWPAASFAELANRLRADGCVPLVIEGPADAGPVGEMLAAMAHGHQPPRIARNLSIEALAALLARCGAYVGNDSGVSHLAALVGIPTLTLFGPTDPAVWRPIGLAVRTVRAEHTLDEGVAETSMTALPVDHVWRELAALRASAPARSR